MDSKSMFGTNQKIIKEEMSKKREEYYKNEDIKNISRQCETEKVISINTLAGVVFIIYLCMG